MTAKNAIPKGLKPWKKGQSGNPGGRPKGAASLARSLRDVADMPSMDPARAAQGKTRADDVARNLFDLAMGSDAVAVSAAKEVFNRLEGKVPDRVQIASAVSNMDDDRLAEVMAMIGLSAERDD